jgi:hypothetical protein
MAMVSVETLLTTSATPVPAVSKKLTSCRSVARRYIARILAACRSAVLSQHDASEEEEKENHSQIKQEQTDREVGEWVFIARTYQYFATQKTATKQQHHLQQKKNRIVSNAHLNSSKISPKFQPSNFKSSHFCNIFLYLKNRL